MDRRLALFTVSAALLASCILSTVSAQNSSTVVKIDVYYESLSIDSMRFIVTSLYPFYVKARQYLKVNLIPFGKASWTEGMKGINQFTCQHGPNECKGNIAQACAIDQIQKSYRGKDQELEMVSFVSCAMNTLSKTPVQTCSKQEGFTDKMIQSIVKCSQDSTGINLLKANGRKTNAVKWPLSFVPTIVINGAINKEAFGNFAGVVCRLISNRQTVDSCNVKVNIKPQ